MNNSKSNDTKAIERLISSMRSVCRGFERMICASDEHMEATLVLIRALERQPMASVEMLAKEWVDQLGEHPVDVAAISMAQELYRLFGPNWYVVCMHYRMREENEACRGEGETVENCPLYGDKIEEVRDMWEEHFETFDRQRAREEAAAKAWLKRQAQKAA